MKDLSNGSYRLVPTVEFLSVQGLDFSSDQGVKSDNSPGAMRAMSRAELEEKAECESPKLNRWNTEYLDLG